MDDEDCGLRTSLEASLELRGLSRVADNAQQQYVRSRPAPSPESIKRAKGLDLAGLGLHPLFSESLSQAGVGWRRWTPQNLLDLTPLSLPPARLNTFSVPTPSRLHWANLWGQLGGPQGS